MIKTLSKQIKGFVKESVLTPVFMILEVVFETLIPLLMASIIDDGINKGDMNHILFVGGGMVLCAIGGLICGILGGSFGAKASAGFARNLRRSMFANIQTFSFSNIDKYSTAGLVTRLTTDVTNLQNAYQMILRMCMRAPTSLICAMVMAFIINAKLASVYLVAIIFLAIVLASLMKFTMKYFNQVFKKYDDLNASVQENVSGIRVVKAFVREDHETKKFSKAANNLYKLFVKAENCMVSVTPIMQLTVYACIIAISWFGANMIVGSTLTTSNLTNGENPVKNVPDGSIEFKDVYFSYNETGAEPVLDDINLKIKSGETVGIIGGTGSSKTSLVNLIGRLYDVTSGEVLVGGRNVKEYDLEKLRDEVSVVLQSNVLFSGTILDNLRWGNENATEEECVNACKLACADDFIQTFPEKYNTFIERGGTNVSGGQKQRICIARALLKKPKILILDDSTSAVDTATDAKIRKAFAEEIPNTTKLIISQRISSVQNADKIIVLDNGKISGVGSHDELLNKNDIYTEIYEAQTKGSGDFDAKGEM